MTARFAVLLEQVDASAEGACSNVEISHGIDRLADDLTLCRRADGDHETNGYGGRPSPDWSE
jgi:hypothetical protein